MPFLAAGSTRRSWRPSGRAGRGAPAGSSIDAFAPPRLLCRDHPPLPVPSPAPPMLIRIGYELVFEIPAPVPMLLMLYIHPEQAAVLREPERLVIEPAVPVRDYIDPFGNRVARIVAPAGFLRLTYNN